MIQSLTVTLFPFVFLTVLFGGGALFRRRNIDMDGDPPINRTLFYGSKYAILLLWAGMVSQSWGVDLSLIAVPSGIKWVALSLWIAGFVLLLIGRLGLGASFRIGSPKEPTRLHVHGLFRFSRNPMYLGVDLTLLASVLYSLNPVLLAIGVFVAAVHHLIVLAEERHLKKAFGEPYEEYCRRVRRYL